MYRKYFGIKKAPFSIAPDPRYLFMSDQHREALGHLLYGIKSDGGFVLLTGEVGTGKTTICRRLLQQLPKSCIVAFIINPRLSAPELLAAICDEFGISYPKKTSSIKTFVDKINAYLLEAHANRKKVLLIIDEAQNLSDDVLEQIRLLTNLETDQRKLLQIILIGQPELRDRLRRPEMRQLAQRIVARCHLGPMSRNEVAPYVCHRLRVAGIKSELFSPRSLARLHAVSGGIPRLMNTICDRSLLGAFVQEKTQVDADTVTKAAAEVLGQPAPVRAWYGRKGVLMAAVVLLVFAGAVLVYLWRPFPGTDKVTATLESTGIKNMEEAGSPPNLAEQELAEEKAESARLESEILPPSSGSALPAAGIPPPASEAGSPMPEPAKPIGSTEPEAEPAQPAAVPTPPENGSSSPAADPGNTEQIN